MVATPDYTRIVTEIGNVAIMRRIGRRELLLSKDQVHLTSFIDMVTQDMVISLSAHLAASQQEQETSQKVKYPADWKQWFKQRWFDYRPLRWLLRKYPVRFTEYSIVTKYVTRMCPHLQLPPMGGNIKTHLDFLVKTPADDNIG